MPSMGCVCNIAMPLEMAKQGMPCAGQGTCLGQLDNAFMIVHPHTMLQGAAPLHYAAISGISANLQMLLEYGADVKTKNKKVSAV